MVDGNTLAVISALVMACTEVMKKGFPAIFPREHGERAVLLTALFGLTFTLAAYRLGLLPSAYTTGDAVMFGLQTWLLSNGLYAASKPMRRGK